ncbi:MAG: hypothetical protein ACRC12_02825, partial [Holosporales bacterium]
QGDASSSSSEGSGEGGPEEGLELDPSFDPIIPAQSESNIEIESPLFPSQESESDEGSGEGESGVQLPIAAPRNSLVRQNQAQNSQGDASSSSSEGSGEGGPEEGLEWDPSFDFIIPAQSESNIEIKSPLFSSQESESDEGSGTDLEISDASSETEPDTDTDTDTDTEPDTDYSMSPDAQSALLRLIQENLGIPYDINDGGITQLQDDQTDATTGVEL